MKINCDFCGEPIDDTAETCPNCGAVNEHRVRVAKEEPTTLQELLEFCEKKNLPLHEMRFFIGEDYKEPRAFGIYKNEQGNFVVYKNKANGERVIRYEGTDEAYAVNEIYQKLKSEILNQREKRQADGKRSTSGGRTGRRSPFSGYKTLIIIIVFYLIIALLASGPSKGYYRYNNNLYYFFNNAWYLYDAFSDDWFPTDDVDEELNDHYRNYSYSDYDGGDNSFEDSDYYYEDTYDSSSWDDDSDWDWGSDSWDSDYSDWDSDW